MWIGMFLLYDNTMHFDYRYVPNCSFIQRMSEMIVKLKTNVRTIDMVVKKTVNWKVAVYKLNKLTCRYHMIWWEMNHN